MVNLTQKKANNRIEQPVFKIETDSSNINGIDFLKQYRDDISSLPKADNANYHGKLDIKNRHILNTILPTVAAIKHRNPHLKLKDLIEETKLFCINQINNVLHD